MYGEGERVFYYITLMNENYEQPAMPTEVEEGIKKGMYLLKDNGSKQVQLLGSGVILREVEKAAQILAEEFNINANVWSVTSFNELTREGMACDEYNRLHPLDEQRTPWVTEQLAQHEGIVVAATDYMRIFSEQIRAYLPDSRPYATLGTDGFGRSDSRRQLRSYFKLLADEGEVDARLVKDAISSLGIDADASPAWHPQVQIDHSPDAPAILGAHPKPVPTLVEEDDEAISADGKAEDKADAPILNDKPE